MDIRYLDKNFAVASQVTPDALFGLRDAGLATIICNRPDGEGSEQPSFAEVASHAGKPTWTWRQEPLVRCKACAALFWLEDIEVVGMMT